MGFDCGKKGNVEGEKTKRLPDLYKMEKQKERIEEGIHLILTAARGN